MSLVIVRTIGPPPPGVAIVLARQTPVGVRTAQGERDYFCLPDDATRDQLAADGSSIVPVHDGWYDDDTGGGVAVWGNGRYFELRDTLFTVRQR